MIMDIVAESDQCWVNFAAGGTACFGIYMERKISADLKVSGKINSRAGK
jgi:hypothetical protein